MKKITFILSVLALSVAPLAHAQNADLSGNWKLVGWTLPGIIPVKGHLPTLSFKDGQVSGTTGCNRFNGKYTVSGQSVTFGPLATTRMACDADLNEQEQTFLTALGGKTLGAVRNADSLTLNTADGFMLNIRRSTIQDKPTKK